MIEHSIFSASSAERWFNCPGSIRLSKGIPDLKTSAAAEEGTLAHSFLEYKLKNYFKIKNIEIPDVSDEIEECVEVALDFIREKFPRLLTEVFIEHKFNLENIYPGLFGTVDFCAIDMFGDLWVIDYKHGKGIEVQIQDNKQLMYYALGAIQVFNVPNHIKIHLVIIQPRCQGDKIKVQTKTPMEILEWSKDLKAAAELANTDDAPIVSGDWCRFCKAAAICPKLNEDMFEIVSRETIETPEKELPKPDTISMEQLLDIIKNEDKIKKWLDACYNFLQMKAEHGEKIPGYKLVKSKANRRWRSEEEVKKEFKDFGEDIYQPRKLKSPAQLEKLKGIEKEVLNSLWEKPDTGVTLVPESDKREESTCDNVDKLFQSLQ